MVVQRLARAQAMVEFALALPIFLLVIYGLLEAGRAVFMYSAVTTASREAARYGAASGRNSAGHWQYQDCVAIRAAAKNAGFLLNIPTSYNSSVMTIKYTLTTSPTTTTIIECTQNGVQTNITPKTGDYVTVTVTQQFNPIVKLVPFTSFPMHGKSSRTLTGTIDLNPPTPVP